MDPDPAFYLNADPGPDPGSQIYAHSYESGSRSCFAVTFMSNVYILKNKIRIRNTENCGGFPEHALPNQPT